MSGNGCLRETFYKRERETLSEYAFLTENTRGREKPCEPCSIRTEFQRDRDRIVHSKSFRRLMHKTQVFLLPTEEHYRTRLSHTLEVTQIARIIARALLLHEDLCAAAAEQGEPLGLCFLARLLQGGGPEQAETARGLFAAVAGPVKPC